MATFKPQEPITTTTPQVEAENLQPGVHKFQLVVEDEAGNRSQPATAIVKVVATTNLVGVPQVVSLQVEAAECLLVAAGLKFEIADFIITTTVAEHLVLKQEPAAGAHVERGSVVRLTISSHSSIEVPHLIGQALGDAQKILRGLGLRALPRTACRLAWVEKLLRRIGLQLINTAQDAGSVLNAVVIRQQPAAGQTVPLKSVVQVFVSRRGRVF